VAISRSHASLAGLLDIKHIDGTERFWQYEKENDPRILYPPEYRELQEQGKISEALTLQ
jgi:hypothetical protein